METIRVTIKHPWRVLSWVLVIASLAMIFTFSGQDGAKSAGLSRQVTRTLISTFGSPTIDEESAQFEQIHHLVRKTAHATIYCVLALSMIALMHTYPMAQKKRYLFAAAGCLLCACTDEFQQMFRSGRVAAVTDVCIDMGGAFIGLALFAVAWHLIHRRTLPW